MAGFTRPTKLKELLKMLASSSSIFILVLSGALLLANVDLFIKLRRQSSDVQVSYVHYYMLNLVLIGNSVIFAMVSQVLEVQIYKFVNLALSVLHSLIFLLAIYVLMKLPKPKIIGFRGKNKSEVDRIEKNFDASKWQYGKLKRVWQLSLISYLILIVFLFI